MMIEEGRIPMSESDTESVDSLIAKFPDESITMTRRDPNETGPVVLTVGERVFEVGDGKVEEV